MATNGSTPMHCLPLYAYTPSNVLAIIGIVLYTLLTVVHIARMLRTRSWDNVYMSSGGACLVAGFSARLYSSYNPCAKAAYGIQSVLLLLGPTLFMFTVTLSHTRFIAALKPSDSRPFVWVPLRLQRPVYLSLNIILAIAQFIGAVLTTVGLPRNISLLAPAGKLVIAIFIAQVFLWCFILAENIYFTVLFNRLRKRLVSPASETARRWKWWGQLFGLAISIIGLGRNLVRLTGDGGVQFLVVFEWAYYAFEGYQMAVAMGAWGIWYLPGWIKELEAETSQLPVDQGSEGSETVEVLKSTPSQGQAGVAVHVERVGST